MKVQVIQADHTVKQCPKCLGTVFRKSTKSRYLNPQKTKGETYDLMICDKCNFRQEYNIITWTSEKVTR